MAYLHYGFRGVRDEASCVRAKWRGNHFSLKLNEVVSSLTHECKMENENVRVVRWLHYIYIYVWYEHNVWSTLTVVVLRFSRMLETEMFSLHRCHTHRVACLCELTKHTKCALTFLPHSLRLGTLDAFVLRASVAGAVNGNPRVRIARQLHDLVFARHFAAKLIWNINRTKKKHILIRSTISIPYLIKIKRFHNTSSLNNSSLYVFHVSQHITNISDINLGAVDTPTPFMRYLARPNTIPYVIYVKRVARAKWWESRAFHTI